MMPVTTSTAARPREESTGATLLREAMKNPGVQDLMRIYDQWQRLERAAAPIREAMKPKLVTWVSDATSERT